MSKTAINAMLPYMDEIYGNPSSLHTVGPNAAEALDGLPTHKLHCSVLAEEAKNLQFRIIIKRTISLMTKNFFPTAKTAVIVITVSEV